MPTLRTLLQALYSSRLLLLLLSITVFLRIYRLTELPIPIHPDEAFMGQAALWILDITRPLLDTYFSTTIISNIFTAIFIKLFGMSILALRLQSVLLGIATTILIYKLVKTWYGRQTGLVAFWLAATAHLAIAYSRLNLPNIQAAFLLTLAIFLLTKAIKRQHYFLFFLAGGVTGLSMYSYTGAKLIALLVIIFLCTQWKTYTWRQVVLFLTGGILILTPLFIYLQNDTSNYFQREEEVFIWSKPEIFEQRWQTDRIEVIMYRQITANILGFFTVDDFSNQYGNGPLLDPLSATLVFFFIILVIASIITHKPTHIYSTYSLFLLISVTISILFIATTESPPLSTRLLILYPLFMIIITLSLRSIAHILKQFKLAKYGILAVLLVIGILNVYRYFVVYERERLAFYQWIEPYSSIANYVTQNPTQQFYILRTTDFYSTHPILQIRSHPRYNIADLPIELLDMQLQQATQTMFILPFSNTFQPHSTHAQDLQQIFTEYDYTASMIEGIPCKQCESRELFVLFKSRKEE